MNLPQWSIIARLGGATFLFAWVLASWVVGARDPVRRRLAAMAGPPLTARNGNGARWAGWLTPLGRWLLPGSKTERARIERLLFIAGHRGPNAVPVFFGVKTALALALPVAWLAVAPAMPEMIGGQRWLIVGAAAFIGLVAPNRWLELRVARRQKRLRDGFPEALDMLVICVEAGLGLTGAIARVADELKYSRPELAAELDIVNAEMRTGVDREVALENLNARTGLVEIRGLVSLLVQTLRFGTGIADSLRVYSSEFRDQRMQAAEERAGKIGTKLIFPLIFCEFPAFFLIAVGPAALLLMESFGR
ncbi:MAG: type II secretion system F family protein [Gammaproteobacteria bacterium]